MIPDIDQLASLIRAAAREELLPRCARGGGSRKADGSLVTEADVAVQTRVQAALLQQWPQYGFLGEEMPADVQQAALAADSAATWCLDPLDGTNNFAAGIPYYSISLALLDAGGVSVGVVYDPSRDECFTAVRGQGAWLNGEPLRTGSGDLTLRRTIALVDFKRLTAEMREHLAAGPPYGSQRSFGSVALDWAWLAAGRCHLYLHGGQRLWDYAAGNLLLAEAGGSACTLQGEPVFTASLAPRSAVAAVDQRLFDAWCEWLGVQA